MYSFESLFWDNIKSLVKTACKFTCVNGNTYVGGRKKWGEWKEEWEREGEREFAWVKQLWIKMEAISQMNCSSFVYCMDFAWVKKKIMQLIARIYIDIRIGWVDASSAASGHGLFASQWEPHLLSIFGGKVSPWNPLHRLQVSAFGFFPFSFHLCVLLSTIIFLTFHDDNCQPMLIVFIAEPFVFNIF